MANQHSPVISPSILERVEEDAKSLDWLSVPENLRIVDDNIVDWICGSSISTIIEEIVALEDKENCDPTPVKKMRLSSSSCPTPKKVQRQRFEHVTASPELASSSKGFVSRNTEANTQWAVRTFKSWMEWRSTEKPQDPVPEEILSSEDAQVLNKIMALSVIEVRKLDGSKYPTSTLNMLLSGLKRYMMSSNQSTPNFLDENDPRFAGLRGTRDTVSRQLREEGVGASVKHAPVISHEEESALWDGGILGVHSPKALLNAIFFMNGKVLCLRGGREHKSLKISQFTLGSDGDGDYVIYTENGSKDRSGSYKERADKNKVVKHYANPDLGSKCYVSLLRFYLQKLPPKVRQDTDSTFYWKPKEVTPLNDEAPWFTLQVIGRNALASMVKRMFEQIGVQGKTNHSLRATGATRLFEANVPEKRIQERTGHKSVDALRLYEHTSVRQQKSVSAVICSRSPVKHQTESQGLPQSMFQGCQHYRIHSLKFFA